MHRSHPYQPQPHPPGVVLNTEQALVLAPLNGVQVNALLHELPERANVTQVLHPALHRLEHIVDLRLGGEPADTEADAAVRALVTAAQRTQDVAGLQRRRRAGAARGQCNILKGHQEGLALDVGERDVDATGVEVVPVAVLVRMLHGEEAVEETVRQRLDALRIILLPATVSTCIPQDAGLYEDEK